MTTQILDISTLQFDASAQVAEFDHNSNEALKAYRAAIDALARVNEEAKPLSGIALVKHTEANRHVRDELIEFIALYDQVAPHLEPLRNAIQQGDVPTGVGSHDPMETLFEMAATEPEQHSGIKDWLRWVWARISAHWPRNSQYSKGQLPASDAVADGTH